MVDVQNKYKYIIINTNCWIMIYIEVNLYTLIVISISIQNKYNRYNVFTIMIYIYLYLQTHICIINTTRYPHKQTCSIDFSSCLSLWDLLRSTSKACWVSQRFLCNLEISWFNWNQVRRWIEVVVAWSKYGLSKKEICPYMGGDGLSLQLRKRVFVL